jgi:hypothetical protein
MLAAREGSMAKKKIDPLNKNHYGGISAMLTASGTRSLATSDLTV